MPVKGRGKKAIAFQLGRKQKKWFQDWGRARRQD